MRMGQIFGGNTARRISHNGYLRNLRNFGSWKFAAIIAVIFRGTKLKISYTFIIV